MGGGTRPVLRGAVLVALCLGATRAGWLLCSAPLAAAHRQLATGRSWSDLDLDVMVTLGAAATVGGACLWLTLVTTAAVVAALTGAGSAAVARVSPRLVRRVVAVCCGLAVGGATGLPAHASEAETSTGGASSTTVSLTGLSLPDRATGAPVTRRTTHEVPRTHTVRAGDSLWGLARDLLGRGAGDARVDAAWRQLYDANRTVVGDDPDLLLPGTVLRLPRLTPDERKDTR